MSILKKIKLFLGLEKPPAPPHVLTLLEELQAQLKALTPEQRTGVLTSKLTEAGQAVDAVLASRGPVEPGGDPTAWQHFEVLVFVYQQLHPQMAGVVDPAYEQLLGKLVSLFQLNAKPAPEVLSALETYVQRFEEQLLLREASGTYSFAISENRKVIRFPFMQPKAVKAARLTEATTTLGQVFTESRELGLLELDTHAPWVLISFLEIVELAREEKIACVKLAGTSQYYGFFKLDA